MTQQCTPVRAGAEATPAAIGLGGPLLGFTWNDWLAILGCGLLVLQGAYMLWRWRRDIRREKERQLDRATQVMDTTAPDELA